MLKIFQNHLFEEKIEKKSPQKRVNPLLQIPQLSETDIYTPNRCNYNFDRSSPYYINITHRRKRWVKPSVDVINGGELVQTVPAKPLTEIDEVVQVAHNLFQLTEKNVLEFSESSGYEPGADTIGYNRLSLVNNWRTKVNKCRGKKSILPSNLDDLDTFMESLQPNNDSSLEFSVKLSSTKDGPIVGVDAQSAIDEAATADCTFCTAKEINDLINSPRPDDDYMYRMTEGYVHTDPESGINLYERKVLAEPVPW